VIQFCLKPRQNESQMECKKFIFTRGKEILKRKDDQLHRPDIKKGETFTYECDGVNYRMTAVDIAYGGGQDYVPRCIAGKNKGASVNLDDINSKLLVRRFGKKGGSTRAPKSTPGFWCDARNPPSAAEMKQQHMACMRRKLADNY